MAMDYIPFSFRNLPQDQGVNPVPPSGHPSNFPGCATAQFTLSVMFCHTCPLSFSGLLILK